MLVEWWWYVRGMEHDTATYITALADRVANCLPSGHTGAGQPSRRLRKVIAGQIVQVTVIGFGELTTVVELPYITGTKSLTIEEAAEIIGTATA